MPETTPPLDTLPSRQRLSTRIVALSLLALAVVIGMVGGTLWLSWQLEGAAAAINDAGSLRMRATRIAVELGRANAAGVAVERTAFDATLALLRRGNPSRPLFLPDDAAIHARFAAVERAWHTQLRPLAADDGAGLAAYLQALPGFVAQTHELVRMIERDNARKTTWLRASQAVLLAIACVGTLAVIYLLYLWIILPVQRLELGIRRMAAHEFGVRLEVDSRDEFGVLTAGFNRMAGELEESYAELERRVADKTAQLAAQNRELTALYDMTAFLAQPLTIDPLCRGFLRRVMQQFEALGGSVRLVDPDGEKLHLLVSEGLPAALEDAEHCMRVDACFCGQAAQRGSVLIRDLRREAPAGLAPGDALACSRAGFRGIAVFRILTQDAVLGTFSLHFARERELPAAERQLLETLGRHLGVALDNLRLSASARQLAVAEERNLVAQGLHDSIAQGLNYLNLQVQMLNEAAAAGQLDEVREIVPRLRAGVEESYQDVRELLLNFRSKLEQGQLGPAIEDTVARFRRQTGLEVALSIDEHDGAPLPPEQQLQVLFILQEALSNIRKHAQAQRVQVDVRNGRDFHLQVVDDGRGYDPAALAASGEGHVGLRIMQERAARLSARLALHAAPGQGVRVELALPRGDRQPA